VSDSVDRRPEADVGVDRKSLRELAGSITGRVVLPDDREYDDACRVFNAMHNWRRPAAVVRCADERDIVEALLRLRHSGAAIAVRGGGHHIAGFGTCDGGVVIDLGDLRDTRVDGSAHRVRVAGGATLGDVDVATSLAGEAVPLGVVSRTGVAGLALGGGVGWLTRAYGYTCDSLVSLRVVTTEGTILTASADENPDLFWGLQGGGGNFGIVSEFEFRTSPVDLVTVAHASHVVGTEARTESLLRFYRDWTAGLSRDVTTWMTIQYRDPLATEAPGELALNVMACHSGREDGESELAPLLQEGHPIDAGSQQMRLVELQHARDQGVAAREGLLRYDKGEMLVELTDHALSSIAHYSHRLPTDTSLFAMGLMGGALADRDESDAAVGLRNAEHLAGFSLATETDDGLEANIEWVRDAWSAFVDRSAGGVYLNFSGDESSERVLQSLGTTEHDVKRQRLRDLKRRYDPDNILRINHNILPSEG
jgi:FAD/FMN-containing dehydrogenase